MIIINVRLFLWIYRISANSFRGNYAFLEVGVQQVFKEETIVWGECIQGQKLYEET